METNEIINRLTPIFCEVFDNDSINLSPNMTASDIAEWDSLGNIRLMISIEDSFGIRFETSEITGAANVGELIEMISNKLGK